MEQPIETGAFLSNKKRGEPVSHQRKRKQEKKTNPMPSYFLLSLSSGAFSNVYKAYDTKNDRLVAVKVVRKFDMNAQQVCLRLYPSSL
jgi:hypothetical protein